MELCIKSLPLVQVKVADAAAGIVEAIVAVFNNVDHGNERIMPGAFKASLERKMPIGVWMHDWSQPVAKTLVAKELPPGDAALPAALKQLGGLYVKSQFNLGTQRGRDAFSDVSFGIIDEFSIGYDLLRSNSNGPDGPLDLLELDLAEWSPVVRGMNPATMMLSAKSSSPPDGLKYVEQATATLAAVQGLYLRSARLAEMRAKDGRVMSAANLTAMRDIHAALGQAHDRLGTMLDALTAASTPAKTDLIDAQLAYVRYQRARAISNGVCLDEPPTGA